MAWQFEFDPVKSASNLVKHGIDFASAQALWHDPDRMEIPARRARMSEEELYEGP